MLCFSSANFRCYASILVSSFVMLRFWSVPLLCINFGQFLCYALILVSSFVMLRFWSVPLLCFDFGQFICYALVPRLPFVMLTIGAGTEIFWTIFICYALVCCTLFVMLQLKSYVLLCFSQSFIFLLCLSSLSRQGITKSVRQNCFCNALVQTITHTSEA